MKYFQIEIVNNGYIVHVRESQDPTVRPTISQYCNTNVDVGNFVSSFLLNKGILPKHDIY